MLSEAKHLSAAILASRYHLLLRLNTTLITAINMEKSTMTSRMYNPAMASACAAMAMTTKKKSVMTQRTSETIASARRSSPRAGVAREVRHAEQTLADRAKENPAEYHPPGALAQARPGRYS